MERFKKVCVIDDDELFVFVAKKQIEEVDMSEEIIDFPDGKDAFEYLQKLDESQWPEIIFLDINMTFMNGWEFLESIKSLKLSKHLNIYMTSSSIDPEDYKRAEADLNVKEFIAKPLSTKKLRDIINHYK